MNRIIIRADGDSQIGTGHIMRCLALAQAWQQIGKQAIFAIATQAPALENRLKLEQINIIRISAIPGSVDDAQQMVSYANQLKIDWIVLDGYHFNAEYQKIIKQSGFKILVIDDFGHADWYYGDIILNQNIHAHENLYSNREAYTQLLLGTSYTMLRKEFWDWQHFQRQTPNIANKILVTLGGADPDNVTLKVVQALQQVTVSPIEAIVVIGGSNPHSEQLKHTIQNSIIPIRLLTNVQNMPELMAWADVAITAGGSTVWELAFMGLPSLILVLADNQKAIAETLDKKQIYQNLGWHYQVTEITIALRLIQFIKNDKKRKKITTKTQLLIDGYGSKRVIQELVSTL